MIFHPHDYQQHAIEHVLEQPISFLCIDMGLGKTSIVLTCIEQLIYDRLEISKVLVVAPLKVAEDTWDAEIAKWNHLKHLRVSKIMGSERQRIRALAKPANIYITTRDTVRWLEHHLKGEFPFDMIVLDESSSFKDQNSGRFKSMRRMISGRNIRRVALTGTPAPNSLLDLWPQLYLLDSGERLGRTITEFRNNYFRVENPYQPFSRWVPLSPDASKLVHDRIGDICISMSADDYLTLPEKIFNTTQIHLPPADAARYREFERDLILAMDDKEVTAANAAVLCNKLLQFAGGAVYDSEKNVHIVHDHKIKVLVEKVEACMAQGSPVMIAYWYQHEKQRILSALRGFKPECLEGNISDVRKRWNEGKIPVLLIHPASAGHGLNLQEGGDMLIWFSQIWSLELYLQTIARMHRQGRKRPVLVDHLCVVNTMDMQTVEAKQGKKEGQDFLLNAVKAVVSRVRRQHRQPVFAQSDVDFLLS